MKKSAEEIKILIQSKLKSSNLILWGYNEKAKLFFSDYKDIYQIKACVTEQKEHPDYFDDTRKIPVISWDKYEMDENDYILIFAAPYVHIENQILASGLKIFEEYVDSSVVNVILSNKKVAIMAGNCQTGAICDFLQEVKGFTDEYMLLRFRTHYWKSRWSVKFLCYIKNLCDLYICMQHETDDIMFYGTDELPENCKIITIPSALTRLYWPQMGIGWRSAKNEYFLKWMATNGHGPFEYGDTNLNEMIRKGTPVDEIIKRLTSEDFYSKEQVKRHIEMTMRTLEYEEDRCDIKLLPYIRENYQEKMLYRDMGHMQSCLIWEAVKLILKYLHMDPAEAEEMERKKSNPNCRNYEGHCTEFPVYPSVAKHMGLKWYREDMLYDVTFYNGRKKMTFEQYISAYIDICSKQKQIFEEW